METSPMEKATPVPQHLMSVADREDQPNQPAGQGILPHSHFVEHNVGSAFLMGTSVRSIPSFSPHTGHPDCCPVGTLGGFWTRHASHTRPRPHQCLSKSGMEVSTFTHPLAGVGPSCHVQPPCVYACYHYIRFTQGRGGQKGRESQLELI